MVSSISPPASCLNYLIAGCTCTSSGGECHCCVPRKSVARHPRRKSASSSAPRLNSPSADMESSQTPAHILARIAELRPVLPKPQRDSYSTDGPSHDPGSGHLHNRHYTHHDEHFYSPYGRAYDYTHHAYNPYQHSNQAYSASTSSLPTNFTYNLTPAVDDQLELAKLETNLSNDETPWGLEQPSGTSPASDHSGAAGFCGCGDTCSCIACMDHNRSTSNMNFSSITACTNSATCGSCINCTLLSVPASLPDNTALSIYDYTTPIDEWIRQMNENPGDDNQPLYQNQNQSQDFPPALEMPRISRPNEKGEDYVRSGHSGQECACAPGLCMCNDGFAHTSTTNGGKCTPCAGSTSDPPPLSSFYDDLGFNAQDMFRSRSSSTASESSGASFMHMSCFKGPFFSS